MSTQRLNQQDRVVAEDLGLAELDDTVGTGPHALHDVEVLAS